MTKSRGDVLSLAAMGVGLAAWEVFGRWLRFPFLPPFSEVVGAAIEMMGSGEILPSLAASLTSLAIGYSLAVVCGVPFGMMMGRYPLVEHVFDLYIAALLAAPPLIFTPILFALFGVSRASQVSLVFLYAFVIIVTNSMAAIRGVKPEWIDMARSFGISERALFREVMLPASLPLVLSGLRTGFGRAIKGMINGEMFIALIGIGAMIRRYGGRFDTVRVFAILLIILCVTFVIMALFDVLERRLLHWADQWELTEAG